MADAPAPVKAAKKFSDLELSPEVLAAITRMGFVNMTPVQAATLPMFLGHKDVAVEACTGSGKTLAFVIPVVERLMRLETPLHLHQVGGIIVSPTRELAKQTLEVTKQLIEGTSLTATLLVGGTDVQTDMHRCSSQGCNIIVATPGRLLDILRRSLTLSTSGAAGAVEVKTLETLVLDEADTLLDLGFADAIGEIISRLPKQRRTGLFSATQTQEVKALARAGLRNPAVIRVQVQHAPQRSSGGEGAAPPSSSVQSTPLTLRNWYLVCADPADKLDQLAGLLRERCAAGDKVIVFFLTCASVDYYGRVFELPAVRAAAGLPGDPASFPILPLHGKQAPKKRSGHYAQFLAAPSGALLCTDVAARGIDVPDVDWIAQFDPPKDPAFFIHRVGRTARAGRSGASMVFLLPKERDYIALLALKKVPIAEHAPFVPRKTAGDGEAAASSSSSSSSSSAPARSGASPAAPLPLPTRRAVDAGIAASVARNNAACGATDAGRAPRGTGEAAPSDSELDAPVPHLGDVLRSHSVCDRDLLEKSTGAFVGFVRGYSEHLMRSVFRVEHLDVAGLATAFGCVRLPKVDEMRSRASGASFPPLAGVDTSRIPYTDAHRESRRQARLAEEAEEAATERAARDARRDRAMKDQSRRDAAAEASAAADNAAAAMAAARAADVGRKRKHKGVHARMLEDWEQLGREERLEKRLKAGKISKTDYRREMGALNRELGLSDDDEEGVVLRGGAPGDQPQPGEGGGAGAAAGAAAGADPSVAAAASAGAAAAPKPRREGKPHPGGFGGARKQSHGGSSRPPHKRFKTGK